MAAPISIFLSLSIIFWMNGICSSQTRIPGNQTRLVNVTQLRSHNQSCNHLSKCDPSKFLICMDDKCQCENPGSMTFDSASNSCVTKLDHSCFLEETWTRDLHHDSALTQGQFVMSSVKISRKTPCVANAVCNDRMKTCLCKNPMIADDNGQCKAPFGRRQNVELTEISCDFKNNSCPPNTGLECVSSYYGSVCQCPIAFFQYFNGTQCVSRAGGPCKKSEDCGPFSKCVSEEGLQQCKCFPGLVEDDNGNCLQGHGQSCNNLDRKCDGRGLLKCVYGTCQCSDELQMFDEGEKRCRGLVGAHCTEDRWEYKPFCANHTLCVREDKGGFKTCKCREGYYPTGNRTCVEEESKFSFQSGATTLKIGQILVYLTVVRALWFSSQ